MTTISTSSRLLREPRTEQQALRAIYDRRAQATAAFFNSLEYASANRWAGAITAPIGNARAAWIEPAREWLRMARTFRLSSTMGARLP